MDFTSFLFGVLGVTIFQYIGIQTNNLFKIIDDGKEVLNQQYRIYQELYIYCVSKPFNKKISNDDARKAIDFFIVKIEANPYILNYLSTPLVGWLEKYVSQDCESQDIASIQYQIDIDFDTIKYKLGYPSHIRNKKRVFNAALCLFCLLISFLYFLFLYLFGNNDKEIKQIIGFFLLIMFCMMLFLIYYLFQYSAYVRPICIDFFKKLESTKKIISNILQ